MKKCISILIIGLMLSLCFNVNSVSSINVEKTSTGNTLYVGGSGPGNFTKIQDAIDNATDGDTVFVYDDSSPYYENNIQIHKPLTLIGENKDTTIIDGNRDNQIIWIISNDVNIYKFTIQNGDPEGIVIYESSNILISDNVIRLNDGNGIFCDEGGYITITRNTISNNNKRGISFNSVDGNNIVDGNSINSNGDFALSITYSVVEALHI